MEAFINGMDGTGQGDLTFWEEKEQTTESWTGDRARLAGPGEDISMSPADPKAISLCLVAKPWLPNATIKCHVDQ